MNCLLTNERGAVAPTRKHKQVPLTFCLFLFSFLSFSALAQTTVTGRVSSGDTSLADVTVHVKGKEKQTEKQGHLFVLAKGRKGTLFIRWQAIHFAVEF